ncbi:uridine kinase [Saccharopolyspora sp. K220]|uniref:uridine kinase n=1 Tax=Saccharopolyspora soli TaxID=2926618 RepID=UPI001F5A3E0D|nr:uridine kinase [Saccharopolyspora soli]MCI2422071.1 uridine kinase [Saccharopolyspora soli]
MTMSARRRQLLDEVAFRVPRSVGVDCVRVAVDGVDGSGKSMFADELAERLRRANRDVVRVSADDFHHVRAIRHRRGRDSPEGFWLDSYDYASLRRRVLDPLGPGGSRRYQPAAHDLATDLRVSPPHRHAPPGAVLLLDGLFLHRDELADVWDMSIFLQVPFRVSVARMAARDGGVSDPEHPAVARYVQGQRRYFAACAPWRRADLVIDNTDLRAPTLVSAV